jgi:hypothetical protein
MKNSSMRALYTDWVLRTGKLNKLTEARGVLSEAVQIQSPWQSMSQDLLAQSEWRSREGEMNQVSDF